MKQETRLVYGVLLAFYKSTIIRMPRWSFERAGFPPNPGNLLGPLAVEATPGLECLDVRELSFDDAFLCLERLNPQQLQKSQLRRRRQILGPGEFAISAIAYADESIGKHLSRGHEEDEELSDEKAESSK
jgi:hypothetical protein